MSQTQCHGPCPPWNFLEMKLLSTPHNSESTTPAQGASGFYWCSVHFDGAWIKCANKFPGAWRLSSTVTGLGTYYLRWAKGRYQALLRAGPGRELSGRWPLAWAVLMSFLTWTDTSPLVNDVSYRAGTGCFRKAGCDQNCPIEMTASVVPLPPGFSFTNPRQDPMSHTHVCGYIFI